MQLIKEIEFYVFFWAFANKEQRELLKSMIKEDNPNYYWLKKYLIK